MAKEKDTPNLPGSSRMQMPSTGGNGTNGLIKETGGMLGSSKGTSKRVLSAASGTGLKKANPYGSIC
jgi:hypothetical protein